MVFYDLFRIDAKQLCFYASCELTSVKISQINYPDMFRLWVDECLVLECEANTHSVPRDGSARGINHLDAEQMMD